MRAQSDSASGPSERERVWRILVSWESTLDEEHEHVGALALARLLEALLTDRQAPDG